MIDFLGKYMVEISIVFYFCIIGYIILVNILCRDNENFKDEDYNDSSIGDGEL